MRASCQSSANPHAELTTSRVSNFEGQTCTSGSNASQPQPFLNSTQNTTPAPGKFHRKTRVQLRGCSSESPTSLVSLRAARRGQIDKQVVSSGRLATASPRNTALVPEVKRSKYIGCKRLRQGQAHCDKKRVASCQSSANPHAELTTSRLSNLEGQTCSSGGNASQP